MEALTSMFQSSRRPNMTPSRLGGVFAGQSLWRAVRRVGLPALHNSKAISSITDAAEKLPRWLWFKQGGFSSHSEKSGCPVASARISYVERPETPNDPRLHHC